MKTNCKHVKNLIRAHILDCVTYDDQQFPTVGDASAFLLAEFDRVANHPHNMRRFPNNQDRFADYLMGLPFGFYCVDQGIAEFLNGLGINPHSKTYAPEKSAALYAHLIYREALATASKQPIAR